MAFLEERISIAIRYDHTFVPDFDVEITQTGGDNDTQPSEYRKLKHPFPIGKWSIEYQLDRDTMNTDIMGIYYRAYKSYAGFRAKNFDDFTTNNYRQPPTAFDEPLARVGTGIYQLQKRYGSDKTALSIGHPKRTIFKPVTGTTLIGVDGVQQSSGWTVNTTTGKVTFTVDPGVSAVVTGGCEFDLPVRFNSPIPISQNHHTSRHVTIDLIELLNP